MIVGLLAFLFYKDTCDVFDVDKVANLVIKENVQHFNLNEFLLTETFFVWVRIYHFKDGRF